MRPHNGLTPEARLLQAEVDGSTTGTEHRASLVVDPDARQAGTAGQRGCQVTGSKLQLLEEAAPEPERGDYSGLRSMEPGQSLCYPAFCYESLSVVLARLRRQTGKGFTQRMEGRTVRVWRIF